MTHPPRILFADHTGALGGAQLCLLDIAVAFRDRSAVALFEDGPFAKSLVAQGVAVIPVAAGRSLTSMKKGSRLPRPGTVVGTLRAAFALARVARGYDVLYTNSPKSLLVGAVAGLLARRPVIWHLHDILDGQHFSASNIRLLVTVANARAVCVIANSHATADAFVAAGGRRDTICVVYNGIDADPFDAVPSDARSGVRRALGIASDAFVVGSFSRLHPWKGQRVLLDALAILPDVHALIVGGALFSGEAAYEHELRARASSGALSGRVHVLGPRDDIPRLLAACDVVVHTSIWPEPFGRVLVEALLAGRPLVASNAGGVREVVEDGVTGLLVAPGDVTGLAAAIAALRDDPARAASLAAAGSADVRRRFTRTVMIDGIASAVNAVAPGGRA